jgi:branched-subunit amino acid ABC-type transport system permease component
MIALLTNAVGFGLVIASVLALSALGFNLAYAVSKVLNIGFIAYMLIAQFVALGIFHQTDNLLVATVVAALLTGCLGVMTSRWVVLPFVNRGAQSFVVVLVLFAAYTFVSSGLSVIYGTNSYSFDASPGWTAAVHLPGMLFTRLQVVVIASAGVISLAVDLFLRYSNIGRDIRAISDSRELAATKGVNVRAVTDLTWYLSGFLGGLAGVALALVQVSFSTKSDQAYFVLVTAAAFLGGVGKPYGAVAGAVVVGVVTQVAAVRIPSDLSPLVAFVALIAVILFRPGGILGVANVRLRA